MRKLISLVLCTLTFSAFSNPVIYQGDSGIGKGKHLVFIASDHEYRSEETCPAMARILAKHHGFKCTVLFGLNEAGEITAGASNVPGMEALKSADGLIIFTRFLNLPDEQMQHLQDYLDRSGPVFGLRTSSHAFKIPKDSKWARYGFNYSGADWEKGFGHQILGNTWVGHYGRNHQQGTRITQVPEQKNNPILRGVGKIAFTHAGAYNGVAADDFTVLTTSQPLMSMKPDSDLDAKKPPVPSTWTRHYTGKNGKKGRVFHSTQGASEDILDDDYRRMLMNGVLWTVGLEDAIKADLSIAFVGPYQPTTFSNAGHAKNVKPAEINGWDTPILPQKKK